MGENTNISWTNHTWNPWQGCRKVSPGCKHCYAERLVEDRMGRDFKEIRRSSPTTFNAPLRWKEKAFVFTCSISDFFIEEADAWRDEAWEIIRQTPHLTYQNQKYLAPRYHALTRTPAKIHFLSCEPLLGPLDFDVHDGVFSYLDDIEWVIVGGESGPNFRPMDQNWARGIRAQCAAACVPFFYKQDSGLRSEMNPILDGSHWRAMPEV